MTSASGLRGLPLAGAAAPLEPNGPFFALGVPGLAPLPLGGGAGAGVEYFSTPASAAGSPT